MVFSSLTFLCFFMPLCILFYLLWKNRVYRNIVLLIFSMLFYSWGEPSYIILMLAATLIAYLGGLLVASSAGRKKKAAFVATLVLLTANLAIFKYANFFVDTINLLPFVDISIKEIALPIGISFYTFQILSYVIDLYRGEISLQKNPFYLLLYVSFFPQLIAGPIVRYKTIEGEITQRTETTEDFAAGLRRFILGLGKKVILANGVAKVATIIYASAGTDGAVYYGTLAYWVAALAYTMQIYFDFSGYSDMAIGLGRIFGFHFLENFNYPYIARSVTEFWRRWHISLSQWFRDYIYIPLGGNRVSKPRWILNILLVWGLTGLWHGSNWNFVLWGLYFALLLVIEKLFLGRLLEKLPGIVGWVYTFIIVNVSWVIFNLVDFPQMLNALRMMFVYSPTYIDAAISENSSIITALFYLPIAFLVSFPIVPWLKKLLNPPEFVQNIFYLALFLLCLVYVISSTFNPFIYFRF